MKLENTRLREEIDALKQERENWKHDEQAYERLEDEKVKLTTKITRRGRVIRAYAEATNTCKPIIMEVLRKVRIRKGWAEPDAIRSADSEYNSQDPCGSA